MAIETTVPYFIETTLQKANALAIENGYERFLQKEQFEALEQGKKYPVQTIYEMQDYARLVVVLNSHGETAWLDINFEDLHKLPLLVVELPENVLH